MGKVRVGGGRSPGSSDQATESQTPHVHFHVSLPQKRFAILSFDVNETHYVVKEDFVKKKIKDFFSGRIKWEPWEDKGFGWGPQPLFLFAMPAPIRVVHIGKGLFYAET